MTDSRYFTTTKKGEIYELKAELNQEKKEKRRDAIKKIIAAMTVGKDVSSLFPDVLNCMQTDNLELKKLVYLYVMYYAKSQPETAVMAVNTFVKDCEDTNPLVRAMAIRTMASIKVDKITEYLCDPLKKCLSDEDPYVRKTAAVCVAKLYGISSAIAYEYGFLEQLKGLLTDSNPMVIANAVAALHEISDISVKGSDFLQLDVSTVNKLLTALNECTEWGQIFILDALSRYVTHDTVEIQGICERVLPRLAHSNSAVVLSAVKVLMRSMSVLSEDSDFFTTLTKKLAPPLVTLLSAESEVQYVALRNINLVVQKQPDVLKNEIKVFFVKYNDPIYVKIEKLDIMMRLTTEANITQVLSELKEYATEVDVDFVRKSVRAIGRCAIKVSPCADRCVSSLLELIQTKVNYVVQEAVVVIRDIFRRYPNKYENIISTLCENLDTLDESEARASMIWIIGEYADRIDNAVELLTGFLDGFLDENVVVQLQLLTAIVKLFLHRPSEAQELVQQALTLSTQDTESPDLRDRGYIYWRLLSTDPVAAKKVVLGEKPLISEETDMLQPTLLDELICHISTLASVFHKPPSTFVEHGCNMASFQSIKSEASKQTSQKNEFDNNHPKDAGDVLLADLLDLDTEPVEPSKYSSYHKPSQDVDLLTGNLDSIFQSQKVSSNLDDDFFSEVFEGELSLEDKKEEWLAPSSGKGLQILGSFRRKDGAIIMDMKFNNQAMASMSNFAMQINKNTFGIVPLQSLSITSSIQPGSHINSSLTLSTDGPRQKMLPINSIQVAIKNNVGVHYFTCSIPLHILLVENGLLPKTDFLNTWKSLPAENESSFTLSNLLDSTIEEIKSKLKRYNVFTVTERTATDCEMMYLSCKFCDGVVIFMEARVSSLDRSNMSVFARSTSPDMIDDFQYLLQSILCA